MKNKGIVIALIASGVILPLAAVVGGVSYAMAVPLIAQRRHGLTFESAAWKARSRDSGSEWPTRLRMVNDLTNRINLNGMTAQRVIDLLGQPDDIAELRDRYHAPEAAQWHIAYRLGPEGTFFSIDDEWLVIQLDPFGNVTRVAVITD